jgi:hypothetical protein
MRLVPLMVVAVGVFVACGSGSVDSGNSVGTVGASQELMPTFVHRDGVAIEYNTAPPTSGDHWGNTIRCGFYMPNIVVPDQVIVHNMEHGNVVMNYHINNPDELEKLKIIQGSLNGSDQWLVARHYTGIPEGHIAMTAWGVLDEFAGINEMRITRFFDAYKGNLLSNETRNLGRGITCKGP